MSSPGPHRRSDRMVGSENSTDATSAIVAPVLLSLR